ncbi:RagB/SusD family nutrient uptake outer membrane protein [Flammeovirga sp. EKP202]|uniref:RagB/SusD family nutrient uptake outer membrane protein n=1 Tax=Flammeovirga sp. EKP202 TaxID=2770592 RepID=UPI00165F740C|nr:RagB/SusD family nutrient uptake outer membrane protein [Flammeovirga sp. EKP202]MBD0400298.1 RagB/SusD family nutrient uptake outer membrane protein [Flammeovirga sp. EKP202]
MKLTIKNIILSAAATLAFTGCSLTEEPKGFLSNENFYKSAADGESALAYVYSVNTDIEYYSRHFIIATEVPTETLTIKPDAGADQHALDRLEVLNNNQIVEDMWRYPYLGINRANAVIQNVPDIPDMDETRRAEVIGEAKFLRALHYFNLVRFFGDVVIREEQVSSKDQVNKGISSMEEVYDFLLKDLTEAEAVLSTQRAYGRANKTAVWALLSKVYLQLASAKNTGVTGYEWVSNADENYTMAADYAKKVLQEQSEFTFENDLMETWNVSNRTTAKEQIFVAASDRNGLIEGEYTKLPMLFMPWAEGVPEIILPNGTSIPGGGWEHLWIEDDFVANYDENDRRGSLEMIVNKVTLPGAGDNGEDRELVYPGGGLQSTFPMKFLDPDMVGQQATCDTPILRYTDIMMVYCEALGPNAETYALMDQIRGRAGLSPLAGGMSLQEFREYILEERGRELAFEGKRLFDLRRTNSMERVLGGEYGKPMTSGVYYFDIPLIEVDTNPEIN